MKAKAILTFIEIKLIDWMIDFNSTSICLGLFFALVRELDSLYIYIYIFYVGVS